MTAGPVLVLARHGSYALELRRAGLVVVEPGDLGGDGSSLLAACVVEAVGPGAPEPVGWARIQPMLSAQGGPPVVAVVSYPPPSWLASLTPLAVLVSAPISGRVLVQHVTTAIARTSAVVPPALGHEQRVIDLTTADELVLDVADRASPEPAARQARADPHLPEQGRAHRRDRASPSLSVPLRMARLRELVDRLGECLATTRSLRDVGEALAATVSEQLSADVAILVGRRPDAPWTVVAGVGLRSLEWRPVPREPPVLGLLDARRPILRVDSSDDIRQQAAGLPCVSRRHVILARYPTTDVVLTVGRDDPTFTSDDVRTLGQALQHESGWDDALLVCDLAESLLPYLDT